MKRILKILLITLGILLIAWTVVRITGLLQVYKSPTYANYPCLDIGENFFASPLVKARRFDFICYHAGSGDQEKHLRVHRLCGMEGDRIEIRDGVLYVNGENADRDLDLAQGYFGPMSGLDQLSAVVNLEDLKYSFGPVSSDSFYIVLENSKVPLLNILLRKDILARDVADDQIRAQYRENWNRDQFGPVVVPPGKLFVLGDNRPGSMDSRYVGFVDQKAVAATVLWR